MRKKSSWFEIKALSGKDGKAEIIIYDEIGSWGFTAKNFIDQLGKSEYSDIYVSLNSPGGDVFDGLAIYNALRRNKARVHIQIDGMALSIASVIAMAGDTIMMAENAMMMIHDPWSMVVGGADDMRKSAEVLDKTKAGLVNAYVERSGKDYDNISALMSAETWLTAQEALDAGFIDDISNSAKISNSFDLSKFRKTPVNLLPEQPTIKEVIPMSEKTVEKESAPQAKVSVEDIRAQVLAEEQKRRESIRSVFAKHKGYESVMNGLLDDSTATVEVARARLLDAIGAGVEPATPVNHSPRIEMVADSRDKFRAGVISAIQAKVAGKPDFSNEFTSHTLFDIAKQSLRNASKSVSGSKMMVVRDAFTTSTSDFTYLIENVLGKELQAAYGNFPETWNMWTSTGSVPDFKVNSRIRLGTFNSLAAIPEGAEYTYGSFGEEKETIQAATKGKAISITRQMIINDDLGGMVRIAQLMGRAAARTVGNDVYAVLTGNPVMGDGDTLFHANHSNLGTGGAPTAASFSDARKLMRMQRDVNGNDYLNIMPKYVIAPVTLEDTIRQLLNSETDLTKTNSRVPNTVRGMVELITDPRLDANSTTAYYFVADPSMTPGVEVVFLDGNSSPYLESQAGFDVDGIKYKIRLDYGVAPTDWRSMLKNAGA